MSAFVVLLMRSWKSLILFWSPVEAEFSGLCASVWPVPRPIIEAGDLALAGAYCLHIALRFMLVDVGIWEIIVWTIRITARHNQQSIFCPNITYRQDQSWIDLQVRLSSSFLQSKTHQTDIDVYLYLFVSEDMCNSNVPSNMMME